MLVIYVFLPSFSYQFNCQDSILTLRTQCYLHRLNNVGFSLVMGQELPTCVFIASHLLTLGLNKEIIINCNQ